MNAPLNNRSDHSIQRGHVLIPPGYVPDWQVAGWYHVPQGLIDHVLKNVPLAEDKRPAEDWLWQLCFALMASAAMEVDRKKPGDSGTPTLELVSAALQSKTLELRPAPSVASCFVVYRTLFMLIVAASMACRSEQLHAKFLKASSGRIDDLVSRFCVERQKERTSGSLSSRNNHMVLRGMVCASWGGFVGRGDLIELGCKAYVDSIDTIGADGHLANEAVRGASAGWYTNLTIMMLTTLAHMARVQGKDLVRCKNDRRGDISTAIGFLLEVIDRPTLIHRYAAANLYPHALHGNDPFQTDLSFIDGYHRSRHFLSWIPVYLDLDPESEHRSRLLQLYQRHSCYFPPAIEYSGGFVHAFVRPIAQF